VSISLKNIQKTIEGTQACKNVSLDIKKGEIVALLGANGAGKTTTIRTLIGLLKPDSGKILLNNKETSSLELRQSLAYVHADAGTYKRLTAKEHILFSLRAEGLTEKKAINQTEKYLKALSIEQYAEKRMETLSTGNKQRVLIARALARNTDYLILDEPTATLDLVATTKIIQDLNQAKAEGRGILISTHQVWIAEKIADSIVVLSDGKSVASWKKNQWPEQSLSKSFLKIAGVQQ
tara:strand:- start:38123 stop:38830 length:708 start_codon:yes stop_codon:yes gene_type:complete